MATEAEIVKWMERQLRVGEYMRRHPEKISVRDSPDTLRGYLQTLGWIIEDHLCSITVARREVADLKAAADKPPIKSIVATQSPQMIDKGVFHASATEGL